MEPNPHDMLLFLAVVEARSFTAASQSVGLTKSAISQAVKRLEDAVGEQLLFRSTRALSLTDAGTRLIPHCSALRQVQQDTLADFQGAGSPVWDTLTVTAPHALCGPVLAPVLSQFLADRGFSLRLIADDAPVDLVERQVDVAIRIGAEGPQSARISRIGWLTESLYADRRYVAAMGGQPDDIGTIADWIHIANEWQGNPVTYRMDSLRPLTVRPAIRCNTVQGVLSFVEQAAGVAQLPDIVVRAHHDRDRFHRLFTVGKTAIYALHKFEGRAPQKVKDVIARLKAVLGDG